MMEGAARHFIVAALIAAILLWGTQAKAQYNAFKDPAPSSSSSKGIGESDFHAVTENNQAGRMSLGATTYTVVLFKNSSASSIKVGHVNMYPSSNVSVDTVLDRCSDTAVTSNSQCAITVAMTARFVGPYKVEILAEHDGRSGVSTAEITGDIDRASGPAEQVASDLISDQNTIDFGNNIRNEASIAINLSNVGKGDVTIQSIVIAGTSNGLMLGRRGCKEELVMKPGDACPLTISWVPGRPGAILDSLQITHTGARGILTIPIRGAADNSVRAGSLYEESTAARAYAALPSSSSKVSASSDTSSALSGYVITSHAPTRAIISGPSGALIVRDGEEVMLSGSKWRIAIVPTGIILTGKEGEAKLLIDNTFRPVTTDTNAPAAAPAAATAPPAGTTGASSAGASAPTPRTAPPVLQDLQRIIP